MQIQAAVNALRNTRGLPWPKDHKMKDTEDLLDWLQFMFGFQVMKIEAAAYNAPVQIFIKISC